MHQVANIARLTAHLTLSIVVLTHLSDVLPSNGLPPFPIPKSTIPLNALLVGCQVRWEGWEPDIHKGPPHSSFYCILTEYELLFIL
jgi:hypothetical protein